MGPVVASPTSRKGREKWSTRVWANRGLDGVAPGAVSLSLNSK